MKKYKSSPNKVVAKVLQEPGRYALITWLLLLFSSLNMDNVIARNIFIAMTVIWTFMFIFLIFNRRSDFDMECDLPKWTTAGETFKFQVKIKKNKGFKGIWFFRIFVENSYSKKEERLLRKLIFNTKSSDWHNRWAFNDSNDYGDNHTAKIAFSDIKMNFKKDSNIQEALVEGFSRQRGIVHVLGFNSGKRDPLGWLQNGRSKLIKPTKIVVIPKPINMPLWPSYSAKKAYLKKLESKSKSAVASYHGDEFMNIREARREDPLKYTHWKSWAKTGKRWVVEHEEVTNPKMTLIVDASLDESDKYKHERFEQMLEMVAGQSLNTKDDNNLDWVVINDKPISVDKGSLRWSKVLHDIAIIEPVSAEKTDELWNKMNAYWKRVVAIRILTTRSEKELAKWTEKWKKQGILVEVIRVPLINEDNNV